MVGVNFNGAVDTIASPDDVKHMPIVINTPTSVTGVPFTLVDKMKSLWGQCRIAAVKIKYIPIRQNNTSQTTGTSGNTLPVNWWPAVAHFDNDGYEVEYASWSSTKMLEEGKTRLLNMMRPWKIYKKSFKYKLNSKLWSRAPIGSSVTTSHQNMPGQWHGVGDALSRTDQKYGCHIAIQGEGFPPSTESPAFNYALGQIIFTLYVQYGDKL